jgi:hypothetical protein
MKNLKYMASLIRTTTLQDNDFVKQNAANHKLIVLIFMVVRGCNDSPPMTQYCLLLAPPNQTSQEVTHPGIALAEARLAAEF